MSFLNKKNILQGLRMVLGSCLLLWFMEYTLDSIYGDGDGKITIPIIRNLLLCYYGFTTFYTVLFCVRYYLKNVYHAMFFTGAMLLLTNFIGSFISLRSPQIYKIPTEYAHYQVVLSPEELYDFIDKQDYTDKKSYVKKLSLVLNKGIAHFWGTNQKSDDKSYNFRIPFYKNYILYLYSYINTKYIKYEITNYKRAIERGFGLCSQHAIIACEILHEKEFKVMMQGLSGHVVAQVQVNDANEEWWILDADHGVVIPHDIQTIENNPEIIRKYYASKLSPTHVESLIEIYGKKGNYSSLYEDDLPPTYYRTSWRLERKAYIWVWIIPIILMLPQLIRLVKYRAVS